MMPNPLEVLIVGFSITNKLNGYCYCFSDLVIDFLCVVYTCFLHML
jgi:hypothetical protein